MRKHNSIFILNVLLFSLLSFNLDAVFAQKEKNVEITFVYEKIEEIINKNDYSIPEFVELKKQMREDGFEVKYSESNPNYIYKIKKTKVSSEKELLEAMGVKRELFLKYGQKCLLAAFREANSEKLQLKASGLENKDNLEIRLIDTSNDGRFFGSGYSTLKLNPEPDIRNDFWPCSYVHEPIIQLSDVACKNRNTDLLDFIFPTISGKKDMVSTVNHEYAHFLDDTELDPEKYDEATKYGLDGSHLLKEITNEGIAFIEGWAEYNEMIESKKIAKHYQRSTKSLRIESETEAGSYSKVKVKDSDFSTLLKSEAYNANLLYQLSQKIGKEKITETFVKTSDNKYRDLQYFVKKLVEFNPDDAQTICEVVDDVFLNKASNEELLEMVGKTKATETYARKRISNNEKAKRNNSEKTGKIKELGQRLVKALNPDKNKMVEKPSSSLGRFISDVKDILSKGVENVREAIDTIFDKIRSFFKKDEAIAEAEETSETPEEEPCKVIKKMPIQSNNQKVGPSSNPFSVIK